MSKLFPPGSHRLAIQVLAVCAGAAALSGCSADATRFDSPFSNPFAATTTKPQHVASARPVGIARTSPVVAQALPARHTTVAATAPAVSHETTGSIQTGSRAVPGASFGNWTATGGTAIVVAQGDTADAMSKRYGVPQPILLQVNGLKSAADLQPGIRITVPIYNATAVAAAAPPPARTVVAVEAQPARVAVAIAAPPHILALPKTRVVVEAPAVKLAAPRAAKPAMVSVAVVPAKLVKGAVAVKTAALTSTPKVKVVVAAAVVAPIKAAPQRTTASAPPPARVEHVAAVAPLKAVDQTPTATVQVAEPASEAAGPEFRWPARGRIIQGFKGGAGGNDGINIAVPEGTSVKAAEGGTVIYAGNEMKAYGSMVLIRHPNGFISAYANNGEIDVKKGEAVKRGQIIAKSGQTGNVSSPQLHFELRKGRDPVDPTQFLAGL